VRAELGQRLLGRVELTRGRPRGRLEFC
jgi:hypothetical protein